MPERDFIAATKERVVVFDGGMGATLEQFDLTQEDYGGLEGKCHEALVLNRPDVIEGVHASMLEAGAEVVETDTFQGSRLKLDEWGLGEHTPEINRKAAEIARKAAGEKRFVAGSIGPTGFLPASTDPTLGDISFAKLVEVFAEQARGLVEGGADLIVIETAQDILEVKAAIFGAREAFAATGRALPIQTSVSLLPQGGKMLLGTDIRAVLTTLAALDVDVIGLNCSTGPEDMRDAIRYLGENSPLPVHCIPNAGLPLQGPDGETIFPEKPEPLAATLGEFVERYGVGIVGGCCGTTPEHIAAIRERVAGRVPAPRPAAGPIQVSSMMTSTPLVQEPRPTLVGERVNSQGSRRAKELLLADDYDGLVQVAEDQVDRRRPRARRLRGADRAPGRGRADGDGGQADLPHPACADPGRLDRAGGDPCRAGADPGAGDRQLDQPRGRPRQGRRRRAAGEGARCRADRADHRRGRDGEDRRAQGRDRQANPRPRLRGARPRPRGADLRRAHLHPDHRRRGVEALRGRDDRGDPPDQGRDPRRQDLARRLQRLLRRLAAGPRRAQLGLPAPLRRGRARPGDGQPQPHHALLGDLRRGARADRRPRLQPARGRAGALHRPLRVEGRGGGRGGGRPDRGDGARGGAALAHPAPQEGRGRGLDRPLGGEDRRRPDPERGAAAGDEGGRRQVRRRRADPALRPAVGRSDEARRRPAGELPRPDRRPHQGQGGDRDRLRRRPRHRQVAGQHDPHQQRLHRDRPRQAGPGRHDHRGRGRERCRRDRPLRPARLHLQADADLRAGAAPARARVPGADRRRRDQPRLRPPHPLPAAARSPTRSTSPASSTARTPSRGSTRWTR